MIDMNMRSVKKASGKLNDMTQSREARVGVETGRLALVDLEVLLPGTQLRAGHGSDAVIAGSKVT